MTSGIYAIVNTANGKKYVGQTIDLSRRLTDHLRDLKTGNHFNDHLQRAFTKYGESSFEFRILEEVPTALLDNRECAWIAYYKSNQQELGYNKESGGCADKIVSETVRQKISQAIGGKNHYCYGRHLSAGTRRKISDAHKGKKLSDECKAKLSESLLGNQRRKGIPHTEEARLKISLAGRGLKRTDETRSNISLVLKGKKHSEEHNRKNGEAHRGIIHTPEAKEKMSQASLSFWNNPLNKKRMRELRKGRHLSELHKAKLLKIHLGSHRSDETKQKLSLASREWWRKHRETQNIQTKEGVA